MNLKLKLNLKLNSVPRGRSRFTDRVTGPTRGRSGYPEGCEAARA